MTSNVDRCSVNAGKDRFPPALLWERRGSVSGAWRAGFSSTTSDDRRSVNTGKTAFHWRSLGAPGQRQRGLENRLFLNHQRRPPGYTRGENRFKGRERRAPVGECRFGGTSLEQPPYFKPTCALCASSAPSVLFFWTVHCAAVGGFAAYGCGIPLAGAARFLFGKTERGPRRNVSGAVPVGRGGARERAQFSPPGGNGAKRTLRRRQWGVEFLLAKPAFFISYVTNTAIRTLME